MPNEARLALLGVSITHGIDPDVAKELYSKVDPEKRRRGATSASLDPSS